MEDDLEPPGLGVDLLLCDAAQLADGKLYILGGGLAAVGPKPQPMALAIRITVPWDRANIRHRWRVELLDEDGHPVVVRDRPVRVDGHFEAGRPAGLRPGTPLGVSLAINLPPLPLQPGTAYSFGLLIDDRTEPDWRVRFFARPAPGSR